MKVKVCIRYRKLTATSGVLFHLNFDSTRRLENGRTRRTNIGPVIPVLVKNIQVDHLVTSMGLAATQFGQEQTLALWKKKGTVRKYCLGQRDLG